MGCPPVSGATQDNEIDVAVFDVIVGGVGATGTTAGIATTAKLVTVTGVDELVVVPFPSCPEPLAPQHLIVVSASRAQV